MNTTTMTLPETTVTPLRWGWLDRLAGFLCAAYSGEGEGDEGGGEGADPAIHDEDTAFGGDDDDDGGDGAGEGGDQGSGDDEGGDTDDGAGEDDDDEAVDDEDDTLFGDDDEEDGDDSGAEDDSDDGDDDDEEGADDDDDELVGDALQEHNERVETLNQHWDMKLERAASAGEGLSTTPDVRLGNVQIRKEAVQKFKKILEKEGDDHEVQAEGIFEIAMDAVIQTMNQYDAQHVRKHLDAMTTAGHKQELDRRYEEFLKTPEGYALQRQPKLREKFQAVWKDKLKKAGGNVDLAMRLSYKDYFRLAGGRATKKDRLAAKQGRAPSKKAKAKSKKAAKSAARKKKEDAAAAARHPRGRRASGITRSRKEKSEERESAEHILASSEEFFQVQ